MANDRVIDYIIEQANRDDARSLEFEQDILYRIQRLRNRVFSRIVGYGIGFTTLIEMNQILGKINDVLAGFYTDTVAILLNKFEEHYVRGYNNTDNLLEVGNDIWRQRVGIREQKISRTDDSTVDFIQNHAFELLKGYDESIIARLRSELGNLVLTKSTDKATVRAMIERVLDVNYSKAEEIAQQELSRAYNYGVLTRLHDYEQETGGHARKYWHGFLYSAKTCEYCRERIGTVYDLDDDSEQLPAHIRCRCIWLPILDGWDEPISTDIITRANMLNTAYSEQQIYERINNRLGINYGNLIPPDDATAYLSGSRTPSVMSSIANARQAAINTTKAGFNITSDKSGDGWAKQFNTQMNFWKDTVAMAMVDGDRELLTKSVDGIRAVTALPWSGEQLSKWNDLLGRIDDFLNSQ